MEIERKWMVSGWPEDAGASVSQLFTEYQEQGYVHALAPIVRIRLEARSEGALAVGQEAGDIHEMAARGEGASEKAGDAGDNESLQSGTGDSPLSDAVRKGIPEENQQYILCFKSAGLLSRKEIEISVGKDKFLELAGLIGKPLIRKVRRVYLLPDGLHLEVNLVDEGKPTEFMYAEVEYSSEEQAMSWDPGAFGLGNYLNDDVTNKPGQSMSAYWTQTRG